MGGNTVLVHAYIEVTELPDGIKFYRDGLGLTLKRRLSPTWVELAGANLPIYLLANRPPCRACLQAGRSKLRAPLDACSPRLHRGRSGPDGRSADLLGRLAWSSHQNPRVRRYRQYG